MVNFTVTLPEGLKAEMDKFPDVNWSELTRKSMQNYLQNRKNWFPPVEFELKEVHLRYEDDLKKPSMFLFLKATNKLDSQLIIDRILFKVEFDREYGRAKLEGAFADQSLEYKPILSGESKITISFYPQADMLRRLSDRMEKTFWIYVTLTVYVQGYASPQTKVVETKVPIDEWKNEVTTALNSYDADWNQKYPRNKAL